MPVHPTVNEFPRMLFRGADEKIVINAEQKAAALADGWTVRLLPGETADEYAAPAPVPADDAPAAVVPDPPKKKGRPAKE